jgi:hypothetical protein
VGITHAGRTYYAAINLDQQFIIIKEEHAPRDGLRVAGICALQPYAGAIITGFVMLHVENGIGCRSEAATTR